MNESKGGQRASERTYLTRRQQSLSISLMEERQLVERPCLLELVVRAVRVALRQRSAGREARVERHVAERARRVNKGQGMNVWEA